MQGDVFGLPEAMRRMIIELLYQGRCVGGVVILLLVLFDAEQIGGID